MSAGLAITAFMPSIASNSWFCARRSNSGMDALANDNPFVAAMNMDIAGAQVLKAGSGLSEIAKGSSKHDIAAGIAGAEESIKSLSKANKFVNGVSKVLSFTADNINPIICATGAVKVATADDKKQALIEEGLGLGTMFAAEAAAKQIVGMPKVGKFDAEKMTIEKDGLYKLTKGGKKLLAKDEQYKILNGKKLVISRKGLYQNNPFLEKQAAALKDYCETAKVFNKSIKFVPGAMKGLAFACASIGGYKLGTYVADKVTNHSAA